MQAVHAFFKQGPPLPNFETTTMLDPNNTDASNPSSVICVEQRQGRGRKRGRGAQADAAGDARKQHIRETWPGGGSKFCRFVLGKCNMDTQVGSAGQSHCGPLQYKRTGLPLHGRSPLPDHSGCLLALSVRHSALQIYGPALQL